MRTLAEAYDPRRNNFDFLRFALAGLVLWSHSYSLADVQDPLRRLTGELEGGRLGVEGFFVVSGFLVTQSRERSSGTAVFAAKRALRVFPALIAALVFSAFVVAPMASTRTAADYFGWGRPWLVFVGVFLHRYLSIPGTFSHNAFPNHVNASLWTLRYELTCYVLVAVLGVLATRLRAGATAVVLVLSCVLALTGPEKGWFGDARYWLPHLAAYFTAGMLLYQLRAVVPYTGWAMGLAVIGIGAGLAIGRTEAVLPIFGSYLLLVAACTPRLPLAGFGQRGDVSYGLYVYAYPIQQLVLHVAGGSTDPLRVLAVSFPATLAIAALSWRFIEAPALARKPRSSPDASPAQGRTGWNHRQSAK